MTVFKIKTALRTEGFRFESVHKAAAERKLAEVRERDPQAKIVAVQPR
jgi:hypothetical protein